MGIGVASDSCADKATPAGSQGSQENAEMVDDLRVTQGVHQERDISRHPTRRAIVPPRPPKMSPQQQHLRELLLSRAVAPGLCRVILPGWLQNSEVRGGRKTLSMCSGSTTSLMLPTLGRQIGYDSGTPSSPHTRRRH